jgi:hypothetical protein
MKIKVVCLFSVAAFLIGDTCFAASAKDYQVTGPVLEVSSTMIAVKKGNERWEIARSSDTKADSEIKVGDKVTVHYTMTATKIEGKGAAKADAKASASPSAEKK